MRAIFTTYESYAAIGNARDSFGPSPPFAIARARKLSHERKGQYIYWDHSVTFLLMSPTDYNGFFSHCWPFFSLSRYSHGHQQEHESFSNRDVRLCYLSTLVVFLSGLVFPFFLLSHVSLKTLLGILKR